MKGSPYSRISNSSSARASLHLPYIGNLLPSRVISYSVSKTVLSALTVQYAKAEPTLAFHAASPGHCKTAFNGFGGTKDLLDGAKVVVELVRAEKGNYENGLWIEATKRRQGEYRRTLAMGLSQGSNYRRSALLG